MWCEIQAGKVGWGPTSQALASRLTGHLLCTGRTFQVANKLEAEQLSLKKDVQGTINLSLTCTHSNWPSINTSWMSEYRDSSQDPCQECCWCLFNKNNLPVSKIRGCPQGYGCPCLTFNWEDTGLLGYYGCIQPVNTPGAKAIDESLEMMVNMVVTGPFLSAVSLRTGDTYRGNRAGHSGAPKAGRLQGVCFPVSPQVTTALLLELMLLPVS